MPLPFATSASPRPTARKRLAFVWGWVLLASLVPAAGPDDESSTDQSAVVALPPFYVEPDRPFRWNRVTGPGFELLTTHDRNFGRAFATSYYRQLELIRLVIPDRYLWKSGGPETFIVVEPDHRRPKSDSLLSRILEKNDDRTRRGERRQFLPNFGLSGADCATVFAFVDLNEGKEFSDFGGSFGRGFGAPSPPSDLEFHANTNRITERLLRAYPALPVWSIHGLIDVYDSFRFVSTWIELTPLEPLPPLVVAVAVAPGSEEGVQNDDGSLEPASPPVPEVVLGEVVPPLRPPLLDLTFVFHHELPEEPTLAQAWRQQCSLFVRWALFADDRAHQSAFWKLIDRHEFAVLNEEIFRECFDLSFAEAATRITAFRESDATQKRTLRLKKFDPPAEIASARASRAEVARILSDWERLETEYIRQLQPDLTEIYLTRARQTIATAKQAGHGSPELTAVSGLLEFEAGNLTTARPALETAWAQGVRRPHLLQALAQMRFEAARSTVPADKKLDITHIGPALSLLRLAHESAPAIPATYSQFAELWDQSDEPLLREDVVILAAGARYFPQHPKVILPMALLQVRRGNVKMAIQVLNYAKDRTHQSRSREVYESFVARIQDSINAAQLENPSSL